MHEENSASAFMDNGMSVSLIILTNDGTASIPAAAIKLDPPKET